MKDVTENNVVEIEEVEGVEVNTPEESDGGSKGSVGKIILGLAVAAGGVALYKSRKKIKAYKERKAIAKLEKAGYVVALPCDEDVAIEAEDIEDDVQ